MDILNQNKFQQMAINGEDQPFYKRWFSSQSTKGGYSDMEFGMRSESEYSYSSALNGEEEGLIDKVKTRVSSFKEQATEAIDSGSSYTKAFVCFCVGGLFLLMALTCLPMILISPNSFNLFFSIGSFFMVLALAFYTGPLQYLQRMMTGEGRVISMTYLCCLVFSVYFSVFNGAYVYSILVCVLQVASLAWLLVSKVSGSEQALSSARGLVPDKESAKFWFGLFREQASKKGMFDV